MSRRSPHAFAGLRSVIAIGGLAAVLLVGCGGSGQAANSTASAEKSREQKFLQFAKCLREHGLNVQTPTGGGPFRIRAQGAGTPQAFDAARNAFKKYAPFDRPNLTPQQRVEREEAVRKFAKCMREQGVKLQTETRSGGGGFGIRIRRSEGGPNPESPAFQAAQKACQSLLPKRPGGARAGGPGGFSTNTTGAGNAPAGGGPKVGFSIGG